jgi:hypothetical protein
MKLHQIIGLTKTIVAGISYQTGVNDTILINENGRGITKKTDFVQYIIYVVCENAYYTIHLSTLDCASFSGKLCNRGVMKISHSTRRDAESTMTHFPIKPLRVFADVAEKEYEWDESLTIYLHDEPDTCVFRFDGIGNDEKEPCGRVHVNMDLFTTVA